MKAELPKTYNPQEIESRWYQWWESKGYFRADAASQKPPFVMMMPPPNVTGSLHMGHMLSHTVHDVIVRRKRMQGFNTLWLPGMDHAGIATQNVVERELRERGPEPPRSGTRKIRSPRLAMEGTIRRHHPETDSPDRVFMRLVT